MLDLRVVFFAALVVCVCGSYRLLHFIIRPFFSSLREIPGPPCPSFLLGNRREMMNRPVSEVQEQWIEEYGETICFKFPLNDDRLQTLDLKANARFINRPDIYQRPSFVRQLFSKALGNGLLALHGDDHKRQRRVLNQAFGQNQVNQLSGAFLAKANELRDAINNTNVFTASDSESHGTPKSSPQRVDMLSWASRAMLDVIGLAGFSYNFNSLNATVDQPNELYEAFKKLTGSVENIRTWLILTTFVPILQYLPIKQEREVARSRGIMYRIGFGLVQEKKASIKASTHTNKFSKESIEGRDLLSLLVRANMASDLSSSQRLSDEEVLNQIPTFLAAGHDTTATALSFALHALSLHQNVQQRLRTELRSLILHDSHSTEPLDSKILNALHSLPLLDAVVKETLRLYPPVLGVARTAACDDIVMLEKSYKDRQGNLRDSIRISKGDTVIIPISVLHRLPSLWGADAKQFNPDRWLGDGPPAAVSNSPGVFPPLLSFLGGPHGCIGWRFSILEMKIFLHVLISSYEWTPAVEGVFQKPDFAVSRPVVHTELKKGYQLPLMVTQTGQVREA